MQGKIDRLIGIGTCYGMEKNVDKTSTLLQIMINKKTEHCGIFQTFGMLCAIFTREIESRISVIKAGFNKKKALFACKFD